MQHSGIQKQIQSNHLWVAVAPWCYGIRMDWIGLDLWAGGNLEHLTILTMIWWGNKHWAGFSMGADQDGGHTCEEGSLAFHLKYKQQIVMVEGVLRLLKSSSFQKLSIKVSYNVVSDLFTCWNLYSFTCHPFLCHTFTISQFQSFILFYKEGHNEWFLPY